MKIIRGKRTIKLDPNLSSTNRSISRNKSSPNNSQDDYGLKKIYHEYEFQRGCDLKQNMMPSKKINFSEKNLLEKNIEYQQKKNRVYSHRNNLNGKICNFDNILKTQENNKLDKNLGNQNTNRRKTTGYRSLDNRYGVNIRVREDSHFDQRCLVEEDFLRCVFGEDLQILNQSKKSFNKLDNETSQSKNKNLSEILSKRQEKAPILSTIKKYEPVEITSTSIPLNIEKIKEFKNLNIEKNLRNSELNFKSQKVRKVISVEKFNSFKNLSNSIVEIADNQPRFGVDYDFQSVRIAQKSAQPNQEVKRILFDQNHQKTKLENFNYELNEDLVKLADELLSENERKDKDFDTPLFTIRKAPQVLKQIAREEINENLEEQPFLIEKVEVKEESSKDFKSSKIIILESEFFKRKQKRDNMEEKNIQTDSIHENSFNEEKKLSSNVLQGNAFKDTFIDFGEGFYKGSLINNELVGIGVLMDKDKNVVYEGGFKNNQFNGFGILYNIKSSKEDEKDESLKNEEPLENELFFGDAGCFGYFNQTQEDEDSLNSKNQLKVKLENKNIQDEDQEEEEEEEEEYFELNLNVEVNNENLIRIENQKMEDSDFQYDFELRLRDTFQSGMIEDKEEKKKISNKEENEEKKSESEKDESFQEENDKNKSDDEKEIFLDKENDDIKSDNEKEESLEEENDEKSVSEIEESLEEENDEKSDSEKEEFLEKEFQEKKSESEKEEFLDNENDEKSESEEEKEKENSENEEKKSYSENDKQLDELKEVHLNNLDKEEMEDYIDYDGIYKYLVECQIQIYLDLEKINNINLEEKVEIEEKKYSIDKDITEVIQIEEKNGFPYEENKDNFHSEEMPETNKHKMVNSTNKEIDIKENKIELQIQEEEIKNKDISEQVKNNRFNNIKENKEEEVSYKEEDTEQQNKEDSSFEKEEQEVFYEEVDSKNLEKEISNYEEDDQEAVKLENKSENDNEKDLPKEVQLLKSSPSNQEIEESECKESQKFESKDENVSLDKSDKSKNENLSLNKSDKSKKIENLELENNLIGENTKIVNIVELDWDRYEGIFKEGKKDGIGYLFLRNGDYYLSEFSQDCLNGYCVFNSNGKKTAGFWENNECKKII